jgi:hypothetical protein
VPALREGEAAAISNPQGVKDAALAKVLPHLQRTRVCLCFVLFCLLCAFGSLSLIFLCVSLKSLRLAGCNL